MQMANEILWSVLFFVVFTAIMIYVLDWYGKRSHKKLIHNYDERENLSRKEPPDEEGGGGKENIASKTSGGIEKNGSGDGSTKESEPIVSRPDKLKGRRVLQTTASDSVGKDKPKPRKVRGFIAKLRARKSK